MGSPAAHWLVGVYSNSSRLQLPAASKEQLGLLLRWQLRHTEEESKKFKEECMGRLQQDFELTAKIGKAESRMPNARADS